MCIKELQLKPKLAGFMAVMFCWFSSATLVVASDQPPNVIIIFVDDQGYYDLGCYGATEVKTPRIDAMAQAGTRFTDYYSAASICSPSRAGLVTGCYPRRVGNHIWVHRADSQSGIHPDELTIAELFQQSGYATACIGKWHLGFEEPFLPHNQGFDHLASPLVHLDKMDPPCWIITGQLDDPSTHADKFRKRLDELGIETGMTLIKDAPHGFLNKQVWFDEAMETADKFFTKTLK